MQITFLFTLLDDRLLLKQKKWRTYIDFILKCFIGVLLFGINLGIDVLNRSLFLLLFGDHRSILNLNDIRGDNNETNCSVPVKEEIYENLLNVARPYRKRLRMNNWLPIRMFLSLMLFNYKERPTRRAINHKIQIVGTSY